MEYEQANPAGLSIAYTLSDVLFYEPLNIYRLANAWWNEPRKMVDFLEGVMAEMTLSEIEGHSGVSEVMYKEFCSYHPSFSDREPLYLKWNIFAARRTIGKAIEAGHIPTCKRYLDLISAQEQASAHQR